MASSLAHVPGLHGYLQQQQGARQQEQGQLQQFGQVMGLKNALAQQEAARQAQAQDEQVRAVLQQTNGDPQKAASILIRSGNIGGAAKLAPLIESQRKASQGQSIGAGGLRLPDGTVVPPESRPKEFAPPELVRLQEHLATLPPGDPRRAPVEQRIKMLGERQGGVTVNMPGSSDTVQGPDGRYYKFQVGKSGDVRAVPIQTPSGEQLRPPQSSSERKAEMESKETIADLGEIERLGGELDALVQRHQGVLTGVVGPQAIIGRFRDIAAGAFGADTPTIEFANKSKLFLSSVRKMVEKDPNLSNQERQNLMEAIGTGFWQTGQSSIKARQDVMQYVKNKRMATLKSPNVESAAKNAWGSYEPDKYEYRVSGGEIQRRRK